MTPPETGFGRLVRVLSQLHIPFMIGGSLASSVHGIVRATQDVDLVADLELSHVDPLVEELTAEFYVDRDAVREALELARPFNIIHYQSGYKFDVFPLGKDPYSHVQFERRGVEPVTLFGEDLRLPVASREDIILAKLRWYRTGGGVSERQWADVRGVLEVQRGRLDLGYLRAWAERLGVEDLLTAALAEAGMEPPR